jgi:hypothetical protein
LILSIHMQKCAMPCCIYDIFWTCVELSKWLQTTEANS